MKKIHLRLVTAMCGLLSFVACSSPNVGERTVNIIPAPVQAEQGQGVYTLKAGVAISYSDASLKSVANSFAAYVEALTGLQLSVAPAATEKPLNIHLQLGENATLAALPKAYGLSIKDADPAEENYVLSIQKRRIQIQATAAEGIYRGLTSLKQLIGGNMDVKGEKVYLPVVEVVDGPRFAWRGLSLDVSRCFFKPEEVKQVIDMASLYKMNVLHMHLSDNQGWRIEIKKYPKLTEVGAFVPNNGREGGFYTQEEFKDLVNYANERFVTILPEVDIPGHTAAVFASYPEFKNAVKLDVSMNIPGQAFNGLDVDDPKVVEFTDGVIEELAALAPGNYVHIGGDEAVGLPHDKFVRFVNKARDLVLKHGKKMVGWQETARADLQEGDVIQHWIFMREDMSAENTADRMKDMPEEYVKVLKLFAEFMKQSPKDPGMGVEKHAKVVLSPNAYMYLDHQYAEDSVDPTQTEQQERLGLPAYGKVTIQDMWEWDPMTFNPTVEDPTKDVAGLEAAIWCETVTNFKDLQFLLMPRLAGVAEKGWSKVENTSWDEYKVRLGAQSPLLELADWNYFKSSLIDWK